MENELDTLRMNDKKQKSRIKQLEIDLDNALKRTSSKRITDRLYNSRGNSPNNCIIKLYINIRIYIFYNKRE